MTITTAIRRYGAADLAEFKALIEGKIVKAAKQLDALEQQLADAAEAKDSEGDWMDDSSNSADIEMLEVMASRQRNHLVDLQNALQRIHNKSYGICVITGELIDKRRLLAVPTTTKSLAAKMNIGMPAKQAFKPKVQPKASTPVIISRVINKPKPVPTTQLVEDDDDFDTDLDMEDDDFDTVDIDFDNYSEEDLD